ncbi:hypothetical protein TON_1034 [Thermococcus onnurineus NA1]|uniref:Uncharacterized protein n=1 Tax=Thermococcus onnurineus (strain NA1) TaxID=523850 RepID=B6YWQ9_THEON|nr:hypothetical protein [Thermococcus onnurineus]ACJ16522.1 hypothetical protein TON_1034 [Thermococcus onnurineus NA1]
MKKSALILLFLFGACLVTPAAKGTTYSPFWFEPGTYTAYYAVDNFSNAMLVYWFNGTYYLVKSVKVILINFTIISVDSQKGIATVGVEVVLTPNPNDIERNDTSNGINIVFVPQDNAPNLPRNPFWDETVYVANNSIEIGNKDVLQVEVTSLRPITIRGKYLIFLENGSVYDLEGRYYGHTSLWGLRDLNVNDTLLIHNGTPIKIRSNQIINTTILTYYGPIEKPNGILITEPSVTDLLFFESQGASIVSYNPQLDIMLTFMGPIADLQAIGILDVSVADKKAISYAREHMKELVGTKEPKELWMHGVSLFKTNIQKNNQVVESDPPKSGLKIGFFISLSVLVVIILLKGGVLRGKSA